jgi:hypothetical protein
MAKQRSESFEEEKPKYCKLKAAQKNKLSSTRSKDTL